MKATEPHLKWFWPVRTLPPKENEIEQEQTKVEEEFSPVEKLEMLTSYMRTSYNYCHWCGVHYKDHDDLNRNCPGLTKDDH